MDTSVWLCPLPDSNVDFRSWSPLVLLAATILAEGEGEPRHGKRAIGEVAMVRVKDDRWPSTLTEVLLQPFQFSCFNDRNLCEKMRRPQRFVSEFTWNECFWSAVEAVKGYKPAYAGEPNHYLNEEVVIKVAGKLPKWFDEEKVTTRIGRHTFLRL